MRRHAIQLAKNTLVVSLPSDWVKQNGIKKGDSLNIESKGNQLIIAGEGKKAVTSVLLDTKGLNERSLRWAFSSLQKQGVDEIEVRPISPLIIKLSQEIVRDLFVGFAIVSQKDNSLLIRKISKDAVDQFGAIMRRAFLVTVSLAEGFADALERGDFEEARSLGYLEKTNNQLTNFCQRLINRGEAGVGYSSFYYVILWNMEKIADEYKAMSLLLPKKPNISPGMAKSQKGVAALVRGYYDVFYEGDARQLGLLSERKAALEQSLLLLLERQDKTQRLLAHHLLDIVSRLQDFSASFMTVRGLFQVQEL